MTTHHEPGGRILMHRAHPWHGVSPGPEAPSIVTAYIELVPTDTVKYEVDKATGLLALDRPQLYSNICPTPYGFIPRTWCGPRTAALAVTKTGRPGLKGDGDPLDLCLLTEKPITHGDILLQAIPIGGLLMIDRGEVDDKVVAVLKGDAAYGGLTEVDQVPPMLMDRLRHYFLTYKLGPDRPDPPVEIARVFGAEEARELIRLSQDDYEGKYGHHAAI